MRQQLPPQIKKITLPDGQLRYVVTVDVAPPGARRKQVQKRFAKEAAARNFLADTVAAVKSGSYVQTTKVTVEQACSDWLASKHGIKPSTKRGYEVWLAPLRDELGTVELQKLKKSDLDKLVQGLRKGDVPNHATWMPRTINGLLSILTALLDAELKQGHVVMNVAKLVDRVRSERAEMKTLNKLDMFRVLDYPDRDRHLWWLALGMGLRRGEIAGLRRKFVNFEDRTIEIIETRVCVGKEIITETPKSRNSHRILPMPDELVPILQDAFGRVESEWVACGRDGEPYHPNYLSERWGKVLLQLGIGYVRLHDARHTYASYVSYKGVPIATVSKLLGHSTVTITASTYLHSQDEAFKAATSVFKRDD